MTPPLPFARALWIFPDDVLTSLAEHASAVLVDARDPANEIPAEHATEAQSVVDDLLAEATKRGGLFELREDGSIVSHPSPRKDPA